MANDRFGECCWRPISVGSTFEIELRLVRILLQTKVNIPKTSPVQFGRPERRPLPFGQLRTGIGCSRVSLCVCLSTTSVLLCHTVTTPWGALTSGRASCRGSWSIRAVLSSLRMAGALTLNLGFSNCASLAEVSRV